ncbi:ECF transporter S component [Levilactobacillus cerevisiae]|uniref:ECF transporter S component n=1 Tax=Levilactobacillus cerevisiae TaxID=1704076 RepID=UPI000F7A28F2|nr:ECF transporter S component [Levilactobacillus cerevisiae]
MRGNNLKQNVLAAILTAMTVALSILVIIPVPATNGFVTLCEVGIYTSAILFGPKVGSIVGGGSGFLIDILTGYPIWCVFSLIIHGSEGFVVGYLSSQQNSSLKSMFIPLLIGSAIMVLGYCFATMLLFGWPAGLASIFSNCLQVLFGTGVTLAIIGSLKKIRIHSI